MANFTTKNAEETMELGRRLATTLKKGDVLAFTGALGAGKTTFCRGIASGLGCIDPVQSPTFTIANVYRGPVTFAHFDAYRISSADDLETAGFYDYLDAGAVVAVEWSENVAALLPPQLIRIDIVATPEGGRQITIEGAAGFSDQ